MDYHEIHAALADDFVRIAYDDVPAAVTAPAVCARCGDLDFGTNRYGAQVVQLLANPERAMAFGNALLQRNHAQFLADADDRAGRDDWRFVRPFATGTRFVHAVFGACDVSPDVGGSGRRDLGSPICPASANPMQPPPWGVGEVWTR